MNDSFESVKDTVELRVTNALTFLLNERSGGKISVSKVCRIAEVNRANLYSCHPALVDQIRALNKKNAGIKKTVALQESGGVSTEDVKLLRKRVKALTFLCIELKLKNEELVSRLAVLQRQGKNKRKSIHDERNELEK